MPLYAIAFLLGVLWVQQQSVLPDPLWLLPAVALAVGLLLIRRVRAAGFACLGLAWALAYAWWLAGAPLDPGLEGVDVVVVGRVASLPEYAPEFVRFSLDVAELHTDSGSVPYASRVNLTWRVDANAQRVEPGEVWRLQVRLKRPWGHRNPGGGDFESWLFQNDIRAQGYVVADPKAGPAHNLRISAADALIDLDRIRFAIGQAVRGELHGSPYAAMVTALTIGDYQGIAPDQWDVMRLTGITHLMAISGQHVALIAGLVFFLVRAAWGWWPGAALRLPAPKAAALAGLASAFAYAALAGFSIPTQRSVAMVAVVMGGILLQRVVLAAPTMALGLFAVLLIDPLAVLAPGFWLSFGAVAVILYGMNGRLNPKGLWWKWGRTQWVVAVGLAPLLLLLFQRVPLLSPVANFVAVPWVSFITVPLCLLGAATVTWLPWVGQGLLHLADWSLAVFWPVMEYIAAWGGAQWVQPAPLWAILCAGVGVAVLLAPDGWPARWLGVMWLLPLAWGGGEMPPGQARFTLLDVGQGLAAVLQTPDHVLVYDTGPGFSPGNDAGRSVVAPFLRAQGVDKIDLLVVSHGDMDHIGGVESLLKEFPVGQIVTSVPERFPRRAVETCAVDQRWDWGGVAIRVLHPPDMQFSRSENNLSCVVRIDLGADSVLLPGDIERGAERHMVDYRPADLAAQVLVAPHHGSKTSSIEDFVQAVGPRYVLFPVGYRNRFGFPKPEVIERYRASGAQLLNSAQQGAITFTLDGLDGMAPPLSYRDVERRYWHSR